MGYQRRMERLLEQLKRRKLAKYGHWKISEGLVMAVIEGGIEGKRILGSRQASKAIQVGGGGGVGVIRFPGNLFTEVYGSTLLALRGGGCGSISQEKKPYVALEWHLSCKISRPDFSKLS